MLTLNFNEFSMMHDLTANVNTYSLTLMTDTPGISIIPPDWSLLVLECKWYHLKSNKQEKLNKLIMMLMAMGFTV